MRRALACTACLLPIMSLNAFVTHSFKLPRVTSSLYDLPSSSSSTYDLVVIGGGSAGLTAAKFAANFGKTVCLIESSKIGGDCTWTGCLPSKTLLSAAKRTWTWRLMNEKFGDPGIIDDDSFRKMLRNVKIDVDASRNRIYEEDDSPKVLKLLGIDIANGRGYFQDAHSVIVKNEVDGTNTKIHAKFGIVIATGAAPGKTMSDIAGIDSIPYWTYENIWMMEDSLMP